MSQDPPSEKSPAIDRTSLVPRVRAGWLWLIMGVLILGVALSGLRLALSSPLGLAEVERQTQGLSLGRVGQLKTTGLRGDLLGRFSLDRFVISDRDGVWLTADKVKVSWNPWRLLRGQVQIDALQLGHLHVLRRPLLGPAEAPSSLPVSVRLQTFSGQIELDPAFSLSRGLFEASGDLLLRPRNGGAAGSLAAISLLHSGDKLNLSFDFGERHPFRLTAVAHEAMGGALAGTMGLNPDLPFDLTLDGAGHGGTGHLRGLVTSGRETPLTLSGQWTPTGGDMTGHLALEASSLTRGLSNKLGPVLDLQLTARPADRDLLAFQGTLAMQNLHLETKGLVNSRTGAIGKAGAELVVTVQDPGRFGAAGQMGPARLEGQLTGNDKSWDFSGKTSLKRLNLTSYTLESVDGPLTLSWHKGQLDFASRLRGSGGAGDGYIWSLMGRTPEVQVDITRLKDQRWLLQSAKATGEGLKLQASGTRTLLGGLAFGGTAEMTDLARANPGAGGKIIARWNSAQAKALAPWLIALQADGNAIQTGNASLDHLLGATPRLVGKMELEEGRATLTGVTLTGADVSMTGEGRLASRGPVRLNLDWSAKGPIPIGPIEVTGSLTGQGFVTGTLDQPTTELTALVDHVDLPGLPLEKARLSLNLSGFGSNATAKAHIEAASAYGPAVAQGDIALNPRGLDLRELKVNAGGAQLTGRVSLRDKSASDADLALVLTKGAFLTQGEVKGDVRIEGDKSDGATARLNLKLRDAQWSGSRIKVASGEVLATGPIQNLPFVLQATGNSSQGQWSLTGQGHLRDIQPGWRTDFEGKGRLAGRELHTAEPLQLTFESQATGLHLALATSDGGSLVLNGKFGPKSSEARGQIDNLSAGFFNEDMVGKFRGAFALETRDGRVVGQADASLQDVRAVDSDPTLGLNGAIRGRLEGETLEISSELINRQGLKAGGRITLPARTAAAPFSLALDLDRPVRGEVFADGEIKPLWDLAFGGEQDLEGRVHLVGSVGGTLADLRAIGDASIIEGVFSDASTGLALRKVSVKARLADNAINIAEATGTDGHGGTLSGQGQISLLREGVSSFRLDLNHFRLIDNEQATATASGQTQLRRTAEGKIRLAGALTIDRADVTARTTEAAGVTSIDVIEITGADDLSGARQNPTPSAQAIDLDVTLKAPEHIFVRGQGLDVEMSMDARVAGSTARPILSGVARVIRGSYAFADKRFEIDPGGAVYLSQDPEKIRLDFSASRQDSSLTAIVRIRGTATRPVIALTSSPALPNDEVVSQVLFGRSAAQLSPIEAAQLASAVAAMAGGGGLDVIGNLRAFAGLDRLSFAGGGSQGFSVSGGKYLTENVLLLLSAGGRDGSSAQVEWNITRSLSLISKLARQGDRSLAVRWRKDY